MKDKGDVWVGEIFRVVLWFVWLIAGKAEAASINSTPSFPLDSLWTSSLQRLTLSPPVTLAATCPSGIFKWLLSPWFLQGIRTQSLLLGLQCSKMRELRSILSHQGCCCCCLNQNYGTHQRTSGRVCAGGVFVILTESFFCISFAIWYFLRITGPWWQEQN